MSIRRHFPDLPPVWAAGFFAVQIGLGWALPLIRFGDWAWPLGWLLLGAGLALAGWSSVWFWRKKTTIEPHETPGTLIVEGPFRLNRNPIYTAMAICLVGTGFLVGALSAVLLVALFPPVITRRFIRAEELALRAAFGPEAERYMARTRRW
ncbi:isoprenylcysteine carboxylmethyltransferase family protein [Pararhodobacter marinus]|uniref:Isoprenylcysteine carboxylmethyltransferase family protein n=1 Tax=Pararhodobacter marinus TaxID=2184063 RepID=A0A2U2C674_9RHOB|nr:methyltransferase [Pararhodobacter marinus]PWE27388.1 isoprenylcysteine carboxylmethyltransferase family protein [Pararhodobacter marinus]